MPARTLPAVQGWWTIIVRLCERAGQPSRHVGAIPHGALVTCPRARRILTAGWGVGSGGPIMAGISSGSFNRPDETRTPNRMLVEVVRLGAVTTARITFQPGWRWSDSVKPVVGTDSCQVRHVGTIVSGQSARHPRRRQRGRSRTRRGLCHRTRTRCLGGRDRGRRGVRVRERRGLRKGLDRACRSRRAEWRPAGGATPFRASQAAVRRAHLYLALTRAWERGASTNAAAVSRFDGFEPRGTTKRRVARMRREAWPTCGEKEGVVATP